MKTAQAVTAPTFVERAAPVEPPRHVVEIRSFCEDAALLRLRVIEGFERAHKRLLERFSEEVLARELHLQPADVQGIARRLLGAFADETPVCFVVSPADAACFSSEIPVRVDAALSQGDLQVMFSEGGVESTLRFRARAATMETFHEAEIADVL